MELYLATSCLQGRPLRDSVVELMALGADGVQLCPGNAPEYVSSAWLETHAPSYRTHHGFAWDAMRRPVWDSAGRCLVDSDSVHPPKDGQLISPDEYRTYEVMYPGYHIGDGYEVCRAMDMGLRLAVDVSHVYIQLQQGAMTLETWLRLREYERITEIHVSENNGDRDAHRPITPETFGLDWARSRAVPVILESYLHRLNGSERMRQLELVRGA